MTKNLNTGIYFERLGCHPFYKLFHLINQFSLNNLKYFGIKNSTFQDSLFYIRVSIIDFQLNNLDIKLTGSNVPPPTVLFSI